MSLGLSRESLSFWVYSHFLALGMDLFYRAVQRREKKLAETCIHIQQSLLALFLLQFESCPDLIFLPCIYSHISLLHTLFLTLSQTSPGFCMSSLQVF